MGMLTSISVDEIRQRGTIRDSDVARLCVAFETSEGITADDADALFSLHSATPAQDPAWSGFFIEAMTDYVVHQAEPDGYVVAENGRWLMERVGAFGRVVTSTELALVIHVLETARWTPAGLAAFALDQIRHAITTGSGPLRSGREAGPGTITREEVELAARIIGAFGGETSLAVTRAEAEALFGINRALAPGLTSPAWSALFVRAVGTAVLAATGHAVGSRRDLIDAVTGGDAAPELLALLLGETGTTVARDASGTPGPKANCMIWSSAPLLSREERALARLERQRLEIVTNEVIEEVTPDWLMGKLAEPTADASNETALLAFVTREASRLPGQLADFAARRTLAA